MKYFDEAGEFCYPIAYWKGYMAEHGIEEMELSKAVPWYGSGFYWCAHYYSIGEVDDGHCGKHARHTNQGMARMVDAYIVITYMN